MNKKLIEFLKELPDQDADDIWKWLDSHPFPVIEMIQVIADNHPLINQGCPYCNTPSYDPCGRGGKRCLDCNKTYDAD